MMKKFSIALHDVCVSWNEKAIAIIEKVIAIYNVPLTVHLVFDEALLPESALTKFLIEKCENNQLEIVFHGLSHECSKNVSKLFVFYHKYQAEYLDNDDTLRKHTFDMYQSAKIIINKNVGICPPCWIATKQNFAFFKSLKPLYIERMLSLESQSKRYKSPVISLGSPKIVELFFLRISARIIMCLAILFKSKKVRIAIHICDTENKKSIQFFSKMSRLLLKNGYNSVLLKDLL